MNQRFVLRSFAAGLLLSACMFAPQSVQAQGSSLFSGSGLTKGGTGGISGSLTGSGLGSMTGGSSARGGATSGLAGALGNAGFGGQGAGASPFGNTGGMNGAGATGFGANSAMVGRNNTGFAGNSRAGQTTGGGGGATRNFGNGGNAAQRGNNPTQNTKAERTTSAIRPRLRVAFDHSAKSPEVVATNVTTRMNKISLKNPALRGVEIRVDGEQLVLTGKVKTVEQSRLAANLLRQEPGVKAIRNDLEIEQPVIE
jgi:hypothetical protein